VDGYVKQEGTKKMAKLTDSIIEACLPNSKEYFLWDEHIPGFGCRIYPSGQKTYVYRFISPIRKTRQTIKIGDVRILKIKDARNTAQAYGIQVYNQIDPILEKNKKTETEKKKISFLEFWERYEKEYIDINHKESTKRGNKCNIKRIKKYFNNMNLDSISPNDISNFKSYILNETNSKSVFTISRSLLKCFFDYAELLGYRSRRTNPCDDIKGWPSVQRQTFLSEHELILIKKELEQELKLKKTSIYMIYALYFTVYTGQRKSEIAKLKWQDIDFKKNTVNLTDSKTGKRPFYLNQKALDILKKVPRIDNNPYIFCGKINCMPISRINRLWNKIRKNLGLKNVRIHDLRHSFASFAVEKGMDLYTLSKLLGHKSIKSTERYAHLRREHLVKATNEIFK